MILRSRSRNSFLRLVAIASVWLTLGLARAEDPVFSGPQVGEKLTPFEVLSVYGETAGTNVDPIKLADGQTTLMVFVHKLTRPGMALTRAISAYALSQKEHGVSANIVWLDDDKAKAEAYLTRAAPSLQFPVPVGVSVDGGEGPGAYGLNRNVELTILVAKNNVVKANFALVQPSVTEAAKIASELAMLIDQPKPEQTQLEQLAYPGGAMMRTRAMKKPNESTDEPNSRDPQSPKSQSTGGELRGMMQALLVRDIQQDSADQAIRTIEDWVGDSDARKQQLGRMIDAVLERGMGASFVQPQLKKWQQEYSTQKPGSR